MEPNEDIDFVPEDKVFDQSISDSIENFDESLKVRFNEAQYRKLRTLGAFIMQGLSFEESCILARIDPSKMKALMMSDPDIAAFVKFKEIAYKAHLMKVVNGRAKDGEAKMAGWLLEKKFPNEFNIKPPSPDDNRQPHVLEEGIDFVRKSGDSEPLVKPHSRIVAPLPTNQANV